MKRVFLLIPILILPLFGFAQEDPFLEAFKKTKRAYRFSSVQALTKKLVDGIENDSLKNVLITEWILKNIKYDTKKLNRNRESYLTANKTKRHKKAHDPGFTALYSKMLFYAGIENHIVSGHFRVNDDYKYTPFYREIHSWNAVQINGTWYLNDITWAGGYLIKKERKFSKIMYSLFGIPFLKYKYKYLQEKNPEYILSNPKMFAKTHFPHDPMWQLLDYPFNLKKIEFKDSIHIDSVYAYFNFKDSISTYKSDPASHQNLKYIKNCLIYNKKNHETVAKNLNQYLNNNFNEITKSGALTDQQQLDSLKATIGKHSLANDEYNKAYISLSEEFSYYRKRNLKRKVEITTENSKLIKIENTVFAKNKTNLSKSKTALKTTEKDVQKSRTSMQKTLKIPYKNPKKADRVSEYTRQEAQKGLERTYANTARLKKIKLLCDSIINHSDTSILKYLQTQHCYIDSLYKKSRSLVRSNCNIGIEYNYSIEDSLFDQRDTVSQLSVFRAQIRAGITSSENSLIKESLKELKKLTNEARNIVRENKKLMINAGKYLDYYQPQKAEFDSLNRLLKSIYLPLFDMYTLKQETLKEDRFFYQDEKKLAKDLKKQYHKEKTIERKRYNHDAKIINKNEKYLKKINRIEKSEISNSKRKYKEKISELELKIKNKKGPKQRT